MAHPRVEISQLSPEERLDLIEELWESLRETPVVTAPQRDELAGRIAALERGEMKTIPMDQVLRAIRAGRGERQAN